MTDLTSFIAGLPKAELHVHHVGSASPRIVAELAARHEGDTPVPADPAALADFFAFRDFAHFIEIYLSVVDLIRDDEDVRPADLRDRPRAGPRPGPVRRAHRHAVFARAPRHPGAGVLRGDRGRPGRRGRRLRRGPALVLRHPGRGRPARRRGDAPDRARGAARRPDQLRPRRAGDRRTAAAVQAVLRQGPRRRAAQRPARRGDHRAGDDLGRGAGAGRRADRARHLRGPGSAADGLPGRARHHRWRSARRPTCGPGPSPASRSTRCPRWSAAGRAGDDQLRRPADVRHHHRAGVRGRRPAARPGRGRGGRSWPGRPSPRRSCRPPGKRRCWPRSTPTPPETDNAAPVHRGPSSGHSSRATVPARRQHQEDPQRQNVIHRRYSAPVEPWPARPPRPPARYHLRVPLSIPLHPAGRRAPSPTGPDQPGTAVQLWCRDPSPFCSTSSRCAPKRCAPTPATRSPTVVRSVNP